MKRGYARVSTEEQHTALQLDALRKAGCTKLYTDEGISGRTRNRPALRRCFNALQRGDTLVVWKLDRLARSLLDLLHMLEEFKGRGVAFLSITESIDTSTAAGVALLHMIGTFSEFERSILTERTAAGLAAAKSRGVRLGRPPKLTSEQVALARRQLDSGEPPSMVARGYGVSRSTLYLHLSRTAPDDRGGGTLTNPRRSSTTQ